MPEQVFKSPGFYEREIDLSTRSAQPSGVPAIVIGAAERGPAFVPTTVGSFSDYIVKFGNLNPKYPGPYAVQKFLDNRFSTTYVRVLGAGANKTSSHFNTTSVQGTVRNAGFAISGSGYNIPATDRRHTGAVQFLVAKHAVSGVEAFGMPMFTNNQSFFQSGGSFAYLVRGMIFTANDTRIMVLSASESTLVNIDDFTSIDLGAQSPTYKKFKLVISSSAGSSFAITDGLSGVKILTASFNPSDADYYGKILNKDPEKFETEKHLLYADFAVDDEIASVSNVTSSIMIASGSSNASSTSGNTTLPMLNAYGRFDTRFKTPKTTNFISQPFGTTEYDLFYVEALDDGAFANTKYKVSVANIKASSNPRYDYGTFALLVRDFFDSDIEPKVLEQYNNLSLDPDADNYVAKVIGDIDVTYNFDTESADDRRLNISGKNPNRSKYVRVVMADQVERKMVPGKALPFGFRGIPLLNTNTILTDLTTSSGFTRLGVSGTTGIFDDRMPFSIIPPVPFRFKATRGPISASSVMIGYPGPNEVVDSRLYWGIKFERNNGDALNTNINNELNPMISSITKFMGIDKLDVVVTGSKTDDFCSNKFTLARVALGNATLADVTGAINTHMKEAAYIRNGTPNSSDYTVSDTNFGSRITFASLLNRGSDSSVFNRFADFAKFTTVMYGGFDGVNILDKNAARSNDKASSTETNGGANGSFTPTGFATNQNGTGTDNNTVASYQTAVKISTEPVTSYGNILTIPGIREPAITDDASSKVKDWGLAMYLMDIPNYDYSGTRIFDGETAYVDVNKTANSFEARAIDNNYVAPYFPNVHIDDSANNRRVVVPATVAALAAIGFNDRVGYPWFAPAGLNRAALDFVKLTQVRINQPDRDRLTQARINSVVKFPREGYVIFSQRTLEQQQGSALENVNVKRMILEIKRLLIDIGNKMIGSPINAGTRENFKSKADAVLSAVQVRKGINEFKVICDDTNNTLVDEDSNKMNVQIRVLPTKAVEFISMDFIITQSGVSFV